jgi:hypothetical protein
MKIVTALSMMQLKKQIYTFLSYLKRKGVKINYAQLGMFDTITLTWIGQAHPPLSLRYEMKHIITKMMKINYSTMQCDLFPQSCHYVTEHNLKMTTRGIALQIMTSDDVRVAKF